MKGLPHSSQNFACGRFSCWHRGHRIPSVSRVRIVSGQPGTASRHPGRRRSSASRPFRGARAPRPYPDPASGARWRIGSKFRLPNGGDSIKSHGYQLPPGGDRDASQFAGVCRRAAGALPARPAGGEAPAAERGGGGHRAASQGGHPPAAAPAAPGPESPPLGPPAPVRPRRGRRGPVALRGHGPHRPPPVAPLPPRTARSADPEWRRGGHPRRSTSTCAR